MRRPFAKSPASRFTPRTIALVIIVLAFCFLVARRSHAAGGQGDGKEVLVLSEKLPDAGAGKRVTAVRIYYPPGGKSPRHHHTGGVFIYVLSGAIRSQTSATGPSHVYRAGEGFFEPPGSTQIMNENASLLEEASFLAVYIADDDEPTTELP